MMQPVKSDDNENDDEKYENDRLANIAKNKALLADLGLVTLVDPLRYKKIEPVQKVRIKKWTPGTEPVTAEPTRRSARLSKVKSYAADSDGVKAGRSSSESEGFREDKTFARHYERPYVHVERYVPETDEASQVDESPVIDENGVVHFAGVPGFTPSLTPKQMLQMGVFGGTYFRPRHSAVLKKFTDSDDTELPADWLAGIDRASKLISTTYDPAVNRFQIKASQSIEEWEKQGWIRACDPRGWFQWYCRFYQGRRIPDEDARQIARWQKAVGPNGRFKARLVKLVNLQQNPEQALEDDTFQPLLKQTLLHWAVQLVKELDVYR